jgi:hypothetical protein
LWKKKGENICYEARRAIVKRGKKYIYYISSASEPMGHLKPTPDAEAMAKSKSLACRRMQSMDPV